MVTDWQMDPVRVQGGGGVSKHATNVESVVLARVEIRVVADKHWHQQLLFTGLKHSLGVDFLLKGCSSSIKDMLEGSSRLLAIGWSQLNELVEGRLAEDMVVKGAEKWSG